MPSFGYNIDVAILTSAVDPPVKGRLGQRQIQMCIGDVAVLLMPGSLIESELAAYDVGLLIGPRSGLWVANLKVYREHYNLSNIRKENTYWVNIM